MSVTPKLKAWSGSNARIPTGLPESLIKEDDPLALAFDAATNLIGELRADNRIYCDMMCKAVEQRNQAEARFAFAKDMKSIVLKWFYGDISTAALRESVGVLLNARGIKNDDE